jgi:hypothetical protein
MPASIRRHARWDRLSWPLRRLEIDDRQPCAGSPGRNLYLQRSDYLFLSVTKLPKFFSAHMR